MSTIRMTYERAPNFPATDQHPDAARYTVGVLTVDAIGGLPTQAEVDTFLGVDASAQARALRISVDESERVSCKVDAPLLVLINQTRAEWQTWAGTNFPTLTAAERARMGTICWMLAVAIRRLMRNGG